MPEIYLDWRRFQSLRCSFLDVFAKVASNLCEEEFYIAIFVILGWCLDIQLCMQSRAPSHFASILTMPDPQLAIYAYSWVVDMF